jgi:aspartate aminotransferase
MIDAPARKLSDRALNAAPSPTLSITAKANALKASGRDVLSFSAGEPDFDTPQNVKDAAILAIECGQTKYTPSAGTPALKAAIIAKLERDNGLCYKPSQIIASCGAKHSIYNLMQAVLQEGDEVLIPSPYWVSYPEQVKLAGATPVIIPTDARFHLSPVDVERNVTANTKMIVINSPSNPTGAVYSEQILRDIADIAASRDILVLSDEIYEKVLYDGRKPVSIASFGPKIFDLTMTINGLSKSHSMTGWRLGYAAGDADIVAAMTKIQDQSTSNPSSITQAAGVEALNGPQTSVEMMRTEFQKRRDYIVAALNQLPDICCNVPAGAFYVFPEVGGLYGRSYKKGDTHVTVDSSDSFAQYLLEEYDVAVIPGSGFGADNFVRLSYATSMETIVKGIERIAEAVRRLA